MLITAIHVQLINGTAADWQILRLRKTIWLPAYTQC